MPFTEHVRETKITFQITGEDTLGEARNPDGPRFLPQWAVLLIEQGGEQDDEQEHGHHYLRLHVSGPRIGANGTPLKARTGMTGFDLADLADLDDSDDIPPWVLALLRQHLPAGWSA